MADFAKTSIAALRAFGWRDELFINALEESRNALLSAATDRDEFLASIIEYFDSYPTRDDPLLFEGTLEELEKTLRNHFQDRAESRAWPKGSKAISNALLRYAPLLRQRTYLVDFEKKHPVKRTRLVAISRGVGGDPSEPSYPSTDEDIPF